MGVLYVDLGREGDMTNALQDRKLSRAFGFLDVDGDGVVEQDDLVALGTRLLARFEEPPTSPKAQHLAATFERFWATLVAELDADHDGRISPEEYRAAIDAAYIDGPHFEQMFRPGIEAVALLCDTDGDGRIGLAEFRRVHEAFGIEPAETEAAFKQLDTDADGTLTVTEFVHAASEFYVGNNPGAAGNSFFGPSNH
jgi:Ca2+-binding EF-hand superfamily protein